MNTPVRSVSVVLLTIGIAACGGSATASAGPTAGATGGGNPDDAAFTWCIDTTNQLAMNTAARTVGVDLDHIQAIHTVTGGSVEQFHADLRADPDYMKACTAAFAAR